MKKTLITISILVALGIGVFASAQTAWIGTSWIGSGEVVSSTNLQSNLDYLFDEKAPIPADCDGVTEFLGWFNGGWTCEEPETPQSCTFNGATVADGASVTAYQNGTPAFGSSCVSETRTCSNGTLSGSYQFASCSVVSPSVCIFDGNVVQHGDTVTAYETASVAAGLSCQAETRTCNNGTLSGSYEYGACSPVETACVFHGTELSEGQSITAYRESSVAAGGSCESQTRTCEAVGGGQTTTQQVCQNVFFEFDGWETSNGVGGSTLQCNNFNLAYELCRMAGYAQSECTVNNVQYLANTGAACHVTAQACADVTITTDGSADSYALTGTYQYESCTVEQATTASFQKSDFFDSVSGGTGFFGFFNSTSYVFIGDWGISSSRSDGENGYSSSQSVSYSDLAGDSATLASLCALKGYSYVSSAPSTESVSASTNLVFGNGGWSVQAASGAVGFGSGSLVCTNTQPIVPTAPATSTGTNNTNTTDTDTSTTNTTSGTSGGSSGGAVGDGGADPDPGFGGVTDWFGGFFSSF